MTSPTIGFPDWGRPVTIDDNPFTGIRKNLTSGVAEVPFFTQDITPWASYQLALTFTNGAASASNYANVVIRFYDDSAHTTVVWQDQFDINASGSPVTITDRLHGAGMDVTATFPGGTVACDLILSNRPADRLRMIEGPSANDRVLTASDTAAVPGGTTSAHRFLPSFFGPGQLWINAAGAGTWTFYAGSLGGILFDQSLTAAGSRQVAISLPLRPLHFTLTNPGGGPITYHTSVWASDE